MMNCTALHCTALHDTALHGTALHCTALHCTDMQCTVLICTVQLGNGSTALKGNCSMGFEKQSIAAPAPSAPTVLRAGPAPAPA